MINNFYEAMSFIKENHDKEITLGLDRVRELVDRLGNPHRGLKFIHVAGTNGKGSVCTMTSEILKEAGLRVGLFTSPIIVDYREQFTVNGQPISQEAFTEAARQVEKAVLSMEAYPSEFEKCVALAFCYFSKMNCDLVILEVGMGGDLDATNVIDSSELSVIVNIDYDHTGFLGDSISEIASKKAGIIKEGGQVVMAQQTKEATEIIRAVCEKKAARLLSTELSEIKRINGTVEGQHFSYKNYQNIMLSLLGDHQLHNVAIVLEIVEVLKEKGYKIGLEDVKRALSSVSIPGRFQVISKEPLVIIDGAHNPHGIKALEEGLKYYCPNDKFVFIAGILSDKDYSEMIERMLPLADTFITITPPNPRALPAEKTAEVVKALGFCGQVIAATSIEEAVKQSLLFSDRGPVCAFGSLYSVGSLLMDFSTEML